MNSIEMAQLRVYIYIKRKNIYIKGKSLERWQSILIANAVLQRRGELAEVYEPGEPSDEGHGFTSSCVTHRYCRNAVMRRLR